MKRREEQPLGDVLREALEADPVFREKILSIRIQRGWREALGPTILRYTRNLYVKKRVLYVQLSSSVVRQTLLMRKTELIKELNTYARGEAIIDIVLR